jgi:hypothetical protein
LKNEQSLKRYKGFEEKQKRDVVTILFASDSVFIKHCEILNVNLGIIALHGFLV